MKYDTLVRVLDRIRAEAPQHQSHRYRPEEGDLEKVNQARARAFIHLYLKVMFGLAEFSEREHTITDGAGDGGIDGYYIDSEVRTIYLIQSKFRTNEKNFESKEIKLDELLAMDTGRILDGEKHYENGAEYNGKIRRFQQEVSALPDVARYSYRVIILANLYNVTSAKLQVLTGGISAEVFDADKTYERLVFPVITGNYYAASDIVIPIDLSNKNAGSKISYNVKTKFSDCEITVLFVPTIEVAKVMHKYQNAILKYNPRSYLDLAGHAVNEAIRRTIVDTETNEFALYNNGITMMSEETNINEKIGQKNKAQLRIKNPQIINGGQTSFTLSRIYAENKDAAEAVFNEKEVLLKIITLTDNGSNEAKLELIDQISNATNKQTPVINADRFANEAFHVVIQLKLFERYGLLYERKRGEFSAGVKDGYVDSKAIVERNHFWRLYYAANGEAEKSIQKRLFQRNKFDGVNTSDDALFDRAFLGLTVFDSWRDGANPNMPMDSSIYDKTFMYVEMFYREGTLDWIKEIDITMSKFDQCWAQFIVEQRAKMGLKKKAYIDNQTGEARLRLTEPRFHFNPALRKDLLSFTARMKAAA